MRRPLLISGAALILLLGAVWGMGGFSALSDWALAQQRAVQNTMAQGIRAVRSGEAGATMTLLAVCFTYGFVHAAGPGHGKLLIGGYGVARRVRLWPLVSIAFAASMAQAAVAVALIAGLFIAFGWTREAVLGISETVMAPLGNALVAMVGLWLVWRGVQGMRRSLPAPHAHAHTHHHDHIDHHHHTHDHCDTCGHAHAPSLTQVQALTGWRDTAALIAGIAIRPCSGALFLLILTWQMGIASAGILGTFVMGLGTASVTMTTALLAVWSREGALAGLSSPRLARALPLIELCAGAIVTTLALQLLARSV